MSRKTWAQFRLTVLVAVLGLFAALVANFISPRGLSLTRNYFPEKETMPTATVPAAGAPGPGALSTNGLAVITTAQALELFHDPHYEQALIVFVDARDDQHYMAGHIPGAWQLDRYYPEKHLATVLPACMNATRVVVYCTGGECEDSHYAAQTLQEAGVPTEHLSVYASGMTEWEAKKLPVETGARHSGTLRPNQP